MQHITGQTKWAKFQSVATDYERLHAERLNVIREACGNAAMSLILAAVVLSFRIVHDSTTSRLSMLLLLCMLLLGALCFWRMHVIHVNRYGEFVENTITFRENCVKKESE